MNPFLDKALEQYYREAPFTLIDVGVSGGIHERWERCIKYLRVVGFEPDEDEFKKLEGSNPGHGTHQYINSALYRTAEEMEFNVTKAQGCSSFLAPKAGFLADFPESSRYDVVSTARVPVTTLDSALEDVGIDDVDFIKIDTQGTELFILQGAAGTLGRPVFGVEIEVEFTELYHGQPLFPDVDAFLRGFGYVLFDLRLMHWKREIGKRVGGRKGQVIFADALYFKSPEGLLNHGDCPKAKLLKALTTCVVYGYFDYALSLCAEGLSQNVLTEAEHRLATGILEKPRHLSALLPPIRGRDWAAYMVYRLYDILRSQFWGHSGHSGRGLGNTGDPILWG